MLLAIAVYVNAMHESREMIDILSALGFCDDNREVQRLYDAMQPNEQQVYDLSGDLVNFVFDNADVNIRTLTGLGTWHAMGGIASVTPVGAEHTETEIPRSTRIKIRSSDWRIRSDPYKEVQKITSCRLEKVRIWLPSYTPTRYSTVSHITGQPMVSKFLLVHASGGSLSFMEWIHADGSHRRESQESYFINMDPNQPDTTQHSLMPRVCVKNRSLVLLLSPSTSPCI